MNNQNVTRITFNRGVSSISISRLLAKWGYYLLNASLLNIEEVITGAYHSYQKEVAKFFNHFSFYSTSPVSSTRSKHCLTKCCSQIIGRSIGTIMPHPKQTKINTITAVWQNM